jgi:drug/metabolite transporter (DMT)-like permease
MLQKLLTPLLFLSTQLLFTWYGAYTGKLPAKGSFFGIPYDSFLMRSLVTQLQFVWLLILANMLFSIAFHMGFAGYRNFVVIAMIWIASGPVAALLFNLFVTKEPLDLPLTFGIVLIVLGGVLVVAHRDIASYLQ